MSIVCDLGVIFCSHARSHSLSVQDMSEKAQHPHLLAAICDREGNQQEDTLATGGGRERWRGGDGAKGITETGAGGLMEPHLKRPPLASQLW